MRISDDHQMKIIQEKAEYNVGDTASLAVMLPYERAKALVTVEREKIRSYRVVDLSSSSRTVAVPIADDAVPNEYVSVLAVKAGGDGIPEFRLGYANLHVATKAKQMKVTLTPDKKQYHPGDDVTVVLEAHLADGSPAQAEFSLAVVDERVVALLGSIDKNILGKFWFPRMIGVSNAQSLSRLVKKVFFATEGGGGGKGDDGGANPVRGNFQDTAYWNAEVKTDENGRATVHFKFPDNITSWQLLAIGATKNTEVGSVEVSLITKRDLVIEPLLPRDLRYDDTARLGATVANTTTKTLQTTVTFAAEGLDVIGVRSKQITLGPGKRIPVYFDVHTPYLDSAKITIKAQGGGYSDGVEVIVPILPYSVPETVSTTNVFEHTAKEKIQIPSGILPNQGELTVSASPNVGNGLSGGLDYLIKYPYGCSEQTTSALLANLMFNELGRLKLTPSNPELEKTARQNIVEGIKKLIAMQRPDGSWGFWADSSDGRPHLTSYVMWGLTQAQQAEFVFDEGVLTKADDYLRSYLSQPIDEKNPSLSLNERAQVVFMLSERDSRNLGGYATSLFEQREKLSMFGKTFLAEAFQNLGDSSHAKTVLQSVETHVITLSPTNAYVSEDTGNDYFMSSNSRSTGIYLQGLLRVDPLNARIPQLVRYLMDSKEDGHWQSTQDSAMALLGLVQYARQHPIDTSATTVRVLLDSIAHTTLKFDQGDVSGEQKTVMPLQTLLEKGTDHTIDLQKDNGSRYFYDISMKVYRQAEKIMPFENGFTVLSEYYALSDKKHKNPISKANAGDTIRVRMKLLVPKAHRNVSFEHHLPAGLEAIDFNLRTSPQNLEGQETQCAPDWSGEQQCLNQQWEQDWWWENVWKHTELRDDRAFLFAEELQPGIYEYEFLATAVTPGTFRVPPARAYEFYNPLANGHNEGKIFTVTP